MRRRISFFIALLFQCMLLDSYAQQNIQFSQYAFNGLSVNPAYAGYKDALYLNTIYRHQWAGFEGAPRTGGVSLDGPAFRTKNMGLGVLAMVDVLGPQQAFSLYGSYAYRIRLDEDDTRRLSFGLGIGFSQYTVDGKALRYLDTGDEMMPAGQAGSLSPDARFGIYYHTPSFYLGVSVLDLFSEYINTNYSWHGYYYNNIKKTQHIYITSGCMLPLSEQVQLKPSIMIKDDFKGPTHADINAMLLISRVLWIGGSYRTNVQLWNRSAFPNKLEMNNAASAIVEYYISDRLRTGYAYDLTINKLGGSQGGTHEISIGLLFPSKKYSTANPRYF